MHMMFFMKIIYLPKKNLSVKAGATLISILYSKWLHVSSGFEGGEEQRLRGAERFSSHRHMTLLTHILAGPPGQQQDKVWRFSHWLT